MNFFLAFFIYFATLGAFEVPVMQEGRVRPLNEPLSDTQLLLPDKRKADWHPLSDLKRLSFNFTPYSQEAYEKIKSAYLQNDTAALEESLAEAWPNRAQLKVERWYMQWPLTEIAMVLFGLGALFSLIKFKNLSLAALIGAFALLTLILGLRIYILGRPPVSSMHETLYFVPWVSALFFLSFYRKWPPGFDMFFALFAASLLFFTRGSPELNNVQAVLNSHFWLMIHVLMIVASYGILIFAGLLGHYFLFTGNMKTVPPLVNSLYLGVALLIPGTILGGIWASQSWGRFWDWDPKESWAFFSSAIYLVAIHAYKYKKIGNFGLAIGSVIGLMSISFTWYGVNYILGTGLHSYGFGAGGEIYYYIFLLTETALILYFLMQRYLKRNKAVW